MKNNRKRILSLLLTLVMLVGLFPASAFADDGKVPVQFDCTDANGKPFVFTGSLTVL